jgi:fatty acid desaturase
MVEAAAEVGSAVPKAYSTIMMVIMVIIIIIAIIVIIITLIFIFITIIIFIIIIIIIIIIIYSGHFRLPSPIEGSVCPGVHSPTPGHASPHPQPITQRLVTPASSEGY